MPKRTRQRGGNCGMDHMSGGRRRKSRRRRTRKGGGKGQNETCTWLPIGSQCADGLSCQSGTCQPKRVSDNTPSAHTMSNIGSAVSSFKFWGGKRRKSRRRRKRSRGRKSRRKRRTKKRRRRRRR